MKNLTLKQSFFLFFGWRYLANTKSKEIHDLKKSHQNCHLELISKKNSLYITERKKNLLLQSYDGCRWCMKKDSKD